MLKKINGYFKRWGVVYIVSIIFAYFFRDLSNRGYIGHAYWLLLAYLAVVTGWHIGRIQEEKKSEEKIAILLKTKSKAISGQTKSSKLK